MSSVLTAIETLQENASSFFERLSQKHGAHMSCAKGCSSCCQVELSLFGVEAARIVAWAENLALDPAGATDSWKELQKALSLDDAPEAPNAAGVANPACPMLRNGACSIYPARPLICRTQGAPLLIKDEEAQTIQVDVCPKNFTQEETMPPQPEWLNLQRLNVLLSLAESQWKSQSKTPQNLSPWIAEALGQWKPRQDGRIPLRQVAKYLKTKVSTFSKQTE